MKLERSTIHKIQIYLAVLLSVSLIWHEANGAWVRHNAKQAAFRLEQTLAFIQIHKSCNGYISPTKMYNENIDEFISWRYCIAHLIDQTTIEHFHPDEIDESLRDEYDQWKTVGISFITRTNSKDALILAVDSPRGCLDTLASNPEAAIPNGTIALLEVFETGQHWMSTYDYIPQKKVESQNISHGQPANIKGSLEGVFFAITWSGQVVCLDSEVPCHLLNHHLEISEESSENKSLDDLKDYFRTPGKTILSTLFGS